MGITVRRAKHGRWGETHRNWVVTEYTSRWGKREVINDGKRRQVRFSSLETLIRIYTCTTWTDAMRIADDLACDRAIDPWRVIALSERRV